MKFKTKNRHSVLRYGISKLALVTLLMGMSTYSFASIEDCYLSRDLPNEDIIKNCMPYAKQDPIATGILGAVYSEEKNYKKTLDYNLWVTNFYKKNGVPTNAHEYNSYTGILTAIGSIYYFGEAGKANKTKGLEYITKAANLGNNIAQNQLGDFYASKDDFPGRNLATAYRWYQLAIAQDYEPTKSGIFISNLDTITKQAPYCIAMGEQLVAQAYLNGSAGLPKDSSKAKEYLSQAIALYKDNEPTKDSYEYCAIAKPSWFYSYK